MIATDVMDFNYYGILTKITTDELTNLLRLLLEKNFYASQVPDYYNNVLKHKIKFSKKEEELILNSPRDGYSRFDLSLLVKILRNCCDGKLETYLISISRIRNELFHLPNTNIRKKEFEIWFRELSDIGEAIEKYLNVPNSIVQTFHSILSASRDPMKERFQAIEKKPLELHAETLSKTDLEKKKHGELKPVLHDLAVQTEDHQRKLHEFNKLLFRVGNTLQPRHEDSRCEESLDPINERLQAIEKKLLELHAETLSNAELEKKLGDLKPVLHGLAVQTEDHQRKLHELNKLLYRVGKTLQPRHEDISCEERLDKGHDQPLQLLEEKATSSVFFVKNYNKKEQTFYTERPYKYKVGKTLQPRNEDSRCEKKLEINCVHQTSQDQPLQFQEQKGTSLRSIIKNDNKKEQRVIESSDSRNQDAKPVDNMLSRGQLRVVYEQPIQKNAQCKEVGNSQQNVISAVSSRTCNTSITPQCNYDEATQTVSARPKIFMKSTKSYFNCTQKHVTDLIHSQNHWDKSIKSNRTTSRMSLNPVIPLRNISALARRNTMFSGETKQLSENTMLSLQEHSLITKIHTNCKFKSQTETIKQTKDTPSPEQGIHTYQDSYEMRRRKLANKQPKRESFAFNSQGDNYIHKSLKRSLSDGTKHFCLSTGQFMLGHLHNVSIWNGLNKVLLLLKKKMFSLQEHKQEEKLVGMRSVKNARNCYEALNIDLRDYDDVPVATNNMSVCLEETYDYDGDVIILHPFEPIDFHLAKNLLHDLESNLAIKGDLQDAVLVPGTKVFNNVEGYFHFRYIMVLITKHYEKSELFRYLIQTLISLSLEDPRKKNRIIPVIMEKLKKCPVEFLPIHPLKYPTVEENCYNSFYHKLEKLFQAPLIRRNVSCID